MFSSLNSIKVIESIYALEETATPVKQHVCKDWMSTGYHKRIQKKWVKRWGYSRKPAMFEMNGSIICHPTLFAELRRMTPNYDASRVPVIDSRTIFSRYL